MKATLTPQQARGKWLAYMRDLLDLNQSEFAQMVGVHTNTISRTENGHRVVDSDDLDKLCEFFQVDHNWWANPVLPPVVTVSNDPPPDTTSLVGDSPRSPNRHADATHLTLVAA